MRRPLLALLLATLALPAVPAQAVGEDIFVWSGEGFANGTLDNEPQVRDVEFTFDSTRLTNDGAQQSVGCVARGVDSGTLDYGEGTAELVGCDTGPDIEGTVWWRRRGTAIVIDGDFTCGNEPKRFDRQRCWLVLGANGMLHIECTLTPLVVNLD